MNINYLKYFVDTANEQSTGKAAKLNFVSQPAISQGIKKLEEQIGLDLLVHKRNSIELTHAGYYILEQSSKVFNSISSFNNNISDYKNEIAGPLRIAVSTSIASNFLLKNLNQFTKKYPKVDVSLVFGKTSNQIELIQQNIADFGLTIQNSTPNNLEITILKKGLFVLAGTKSSKQTILTTQPRPETSLLFKHLKNKDLLNNKVVIESWSAIKELVSANFGYGLIPDFLLDKKLKDFSKDLQVPRIEYELVVLSKAGLRESRIQTEFVRHLIQTVC